MTTDTKYDDQCAPRKLVVILNGRYGVMLRDNPGHECPDGQDHCTDCPDILVFAAEVHCHQYKINGQDWHGRKHHLLGVASSMSRYLSDYGLSGGKTFEVDLRKVSFLKDVKPHAAISLPFPDNIYAHRLTDFAFRDGASAGPHYVSIPGALVFEYDSSISPRIYPDDISPIDSGMGFDYFYIFAGPGAGMNDDDLHHARSAWSQFTKHFDGLTCELFGATICNCGESANIATQPASLMR